MNGYPSNGEDGNSDRAPTDGARILVQTYQTDSVRTPTTRQGTSTQPFGFTGQQQDSNGLVYLRARYYDPQSGRFLSRDSVFGSTSAPLTLNRYSYALNNPLLLTDPSGLTPSNKALKDGSDQLDCNKHPEHLSCRSPLAQTITGATVWIPNPGDLSIEAGVKAATGDAEADGAGTVSPSPAKFDNAISLVAHFLKRKDEFNYSTLTEYLAGARRVVGGGAGIDTKVRANGDTLFYEQTTNEFAVLTSQNVIRTYFRPVNGTKYWQTVK